MLTIEELDKELVKTRFRRAVTCLKDCNENMGYVANEEEMEARKQLIEICREVVNKTGLIPTIEDRVRMEEENCTEVTMQDIKPMVNLDYSMIDPRGRDDG